jgi:phage tail-like protein
MANYPLPKFHFLVQWGGERIGFTEVTGLDIQVELIEYREGSNPEYSKIKMPGMLKYSNITLKVAA